MRSFFDSADYCFRIQSVYFSRAKTGCFRAEHRRYYELIYKLDGSSSQIFPERTVRLLPDCLYIIPKRCKSNDVEVDAPGSVIIAAFELFDCPFEEELFPETLQLEPDNTYKAQFERLLNVWKRNDAGRNFRAQAVFSTILAQLADDRSRAYRSSAVFNRIRPALEHIDANLRAELSVGLLSGLCGVSDEYLRRLFRGCTGKNPLEYIRSRRLAAAKELLLSSDCTISEVAAECGFDDPRYFSRLFRREYGVSPISAKKHTIG